MPGSSAPKSLASEPAEGSDKVRIEGNQHNEWSDSAERAAHPVEPGCDCPQLDQLHVSEWSLAEGDAGAGG